MGTWAELTKEIERLLRLKTFPVALKLLASEEEIKNIPKVRRLGHTLTFCQAVTLARTAGWTIALTTSDMEAVCSFPAICGLVPLTEQDLSLADRVGYWLKTPEDAKEQGKRMYRIPAKGWESIVVAPLANEKFAPDIIMIYGNPAQLMMLSCGLLWTDYSPLEFSFGGESSCSDSVARCYTTGKASLTLPCYGERRMGCAQDDELVIALPPATLGKAVEGLNALWSVGIRYPITYYGAEVDVTPNIKRVYGKKIGEWSQGT